LIDAQRVDFIAVPTRDRERAERFYGETLGFSTQDIPRAKALLHASRR
jgi:catechol 2,3-dioxygenase-like lactoylglutathione lyase family enzyme